MSKTKGRTFRYRFGNETKTFWYRSRICLIENRLLRFGPESALLDQIEKISFDKTNSRTKSNMFCFHSCIRYRNVCETFVKRLFLYCIEGLNCKLSGVFQNIDPSPPSECVPPPLVRGEDTLAGWSGGGVQFFGRRQTQLCTLHM